MKKIFRIGKILSSIMLVLLLLTPGTLAWGPVTHSDIADEVAAMDGAPEEMSNWLFGYRTGTTSQTLGGAVIPDWAFAISTIENVYGNETAADFIADALMATPGVNLELELWANAQCGDTYGEYYEESVDEAYQNVISPNNKMVREQLNGLDDNEQSMIWHPLIAKAIGELYNSDAVEIPKVNNERTGLVHVYRPIIRDKDTVESTMEELTIKLHIEAEMLREMQTHDKR